MTPPNPTDDQELNAANAAREGEEEGKEGKAGKGKSGRGEGAGGAVGLPVVAPLSTEMLKKVMEVWRRIGGEELVREMTEIFSEKLTASANLMVSYASKGYAVVNWAVGAGKQFVADLARTRGASASTVAPAKRTNTTAKPTATPSGVNGPSGMNGPSGQ